MNLLLDPFIYLFNNVAPFFILLGMLIFVHELGHFLVAKYFGVRVETFSLGFGKKIFRYHYGDTDYCISAIPLGGYVKMFGDDPSVEIPAEQKSFSFLHKPVLQRVAVVLAGPLMNLFFAIVIFVIVGGLGEEMPGPFVGDVVGNSKAFEAGFRSGDRILTINNEVTPTWMHVKRVMERAGGQVLEFLVQRGGEAQPLKFTTPVAYGENENLFSSTRQVGQIEGLTPESRSTAMGLRSPESAAGLAGMQSLDVILSVNGEKVSFWRELEPAFKKALKNGKPVAVQVRALSALDKPEFIRTVTMNVPADWEAQKDVLSGLGIESAELYIYQIKKGSPADLAKLQVGDRVAKIGGEEIYSWSDVLARVKGFDLTKDGLDFTILRSGKLVEMKIKPEMTNLMTSKGQEEHRFTIGIVSGFFPVGGDSVFYRITNPVTMFSEGMRETWNWTEFVVMSFVRLIQGEVSPKNVGGVITIGRVASHSFAAGMATFLRTMAIISINLFLINLFPVPVLDGGHLVFYSIEALQGAPLSMRKMELAQQVGLMLLMILMVFAFFNDITNLLKSW